MAGSIYPPDLVITVQLEDIYMYIYSPYFRVGARNFLTPMKFAQDLEKLSPLQVNEATGEPYLPLPAPHSRLRLTPPRPEDVPLLVGHMNDPEIYTYLAGPPFPYTEAHGRQWVHNGVQESQRLFEQIERGDRWIDGCPVRVIRQVGEEDGTEVYVGDIGISRLDPGKGFMTEEAENLTKEVGDPTLWWTVGGTC